MFKFNNNISRTRTKSIDVDLLLLLLNLNTFSTERNFERNYTVGFTFAVILNFLISF